MTSQTPSLATREDAAAAIALAVGRLRRRLVHLPNPDEVTIPEMSALARLDRGGPQTASDLAKDEQISPQSMSVTVAALEAKGLIAKSADPGDGRRLVIKLTDTGLEAVQTKRAARRGRLAEVMRDFTDDEVRIVTQAAALLERIADRL